MYIDSETYAERDRDAKCELSSPSLAGVGGDKVRMGVVYGAKGDGIPEMVG